MHTVMHTLDHAAWVPDDVTGRLDESAAQLAIDWVEQECLRQGTGAILVTNTLDGATTRGLAAFARGHQQTTPRSRWSPRLEGGTGPVLAYHPTAETLDYAIALARRSSLAVVEGPGFPLRGWARETGATDLTRPHAVPAGRDPGLADALNSLVVHGENAYESPSDRQHARHVLDDLAAGGLLDRDALLGALAARGIRPRGLTQLATLIDARTGHACSA